MTGRLKSSTLFSKTSLGELSSEWGELSSEYGASCLLNVGRVVSGRVFFGASCLGASCLRGELSIIRNQGFREVIPVPDSLGKKLYF